MTNITFAETKVNDAVVQEMIVEGHAEYAEYGKDIVCAAVSAITCALLCSVENSGNPYDSYIKEDGGYARIIAYQSNERIDAAFEMALNGMVQIEMAFPKYVTVSLRKNISNGDYKITSPI